MLLNHLFLCHPVLLLASIFSSIRVFPKESALCIRWPKYWTFSIRAFNEYSGLIPFRIDWFDPLAAQRTLKHLLQDHNLKTLIFQQVHFSSVTQSCPTLCNPMNRSMPGLPVHHQLPEFTQTHVHRVGDVSQPSHPLSSPSPPALNLSQHQGLFK